ncbi:MULTISPECIES: S1C family serine protease [Streptomyces]|uniref:Trypsin-like peptidase domain-containing protein n=1 Tax=Streptomyces koelreuteriae TaxID=2838015 RepID=A0ABX8FTL5_9ACTN|nr:MULTISPECIES: trypsin-like peptidase domain-containing protein [Streptomyces]QWB24553.1 trypsin-like peptidase domain-containing protein [Streptomyces koelreuteriae]UUA07559.1 trypsin-like peptidase domain-containing protein [Streptomyces koelreuteriae]UUA15188.1 trypsin-like peptidase domain-containing protein [Streptomyces sp. CRCS-T-1]
MSTENEGTAVPPAPSAPPVPVDAPAAPAPQGPYGQDARGQAAHAEGAPGGAGHPGASSSAPDPSWPPPPPPATPSYGDGGAGPSYGDGGAGSSYGDGGAGPSYGDGGAGYGAGGWGSSYQQPAPKPGRGRGGLVVAILAAALLAGGLGGGLGYTLAKNNDESSGSTTVSASTSGGDVKRDPGTVAGVAAKALPSTVTIEAESNSGEGGTGTGFVFDKQGHIVTNNHVVAGAVDGGKLTATFPSGKKYDAEVVGHAQGYDVAVIKLKNAPSDLKPLTLGDSDKVAVGDATIAIGAPFGLSDTVTTGIISAKNRPVASSDGSGSQASYMSALQTDASINPGNSGGPLLDAQGNVIGINSAIQSTGNGGFGTGQSGSIGLGFAIPINQAEYVAQELIKTGKPVYAKIGASVSLDDSSSGAQITDQGAGGAAPVEPGGPAAKAGLKPGDVITKLDDRVIDSGPTLIGEIWTHKPGDKVTITYERGGKQQTVDVTLGSRTGDS